jgi:2-C-methyl-D-erythritol 4-phosphate cytidylyltransferase/2-C-methyl-D-erythritol 2,4-cyclodiphosphate synthase
MTVAALIVAAGRGARAGGGLPKQYRSIAGKPMVRWSLEVFAGAVDHVVAAIDPEDDGHFRMAVAGLDVTAVSGGQTRTASVRAGLEALSTSPPELVLIHDAARPGVTPALIGAVIDALGDAEAVAPGLPVSDALKRTAHGWVADDVARTDLWRVQTPQGFHFGRLLGAYRALPADTIHDDDLAVARAAGLRTRLVPGDARNGKITYAEDHAMIERLMAPTTTPCVGSGFDAHRFGPGDHVTLCGVRIGHDRGLVGHSDADAGWHALTDALLGAIGAGDIGDHFPPSDPRWRGADSEVFLRRAVELVSDVGGRIAHADITLICERPRIGPHREAMRARTASVLALPLSRVSVKATTTERMGFTGREEGLAAQATATVLLP